MTQVRAPAGRFRRVKTLSANQAIRTAVSKIANDPNERLTTLQYQDGLQLPLSEVYNGLLPVCIVSRESLTRRNSYEPERSTA